MRCKRQGVSAGTHILLSNINSSLRSWHAVVGVWPPWINGEVRNNAPTPPVMFDCAHILIKYGLELAVPWQHHKTLLLSDALWMWCSLEQKSDHFSCPLTNPVLGLYHVAKQCHKSNYKNIKDHNNNRGSNLTSTQVLWASELHFWPETSPTLQLDCQAGAQLYSLGWSWCFRFITYTLSSLVLPSQLATQLIEATLSPTCSYRCETDSRLIYTGSNIPDKEQWAFQMKEPRFIPLVWSQTEPPVPASLKAKCPVVAACSTFLLITDHSKLSD